MSNCIHRTGDCTTILPGISQCVCGQLFVFISRGGCGRFKLIEEVTEEDRQAFDPEMAEEFERFRREKG